MQPDHGEKEGVKEGDEALMRAVAAGDKTAFAILLERHVDRLHHFVVQTTDATAADDIVQEAFLKVWTNAGQFSGKQASFRTWLVRIARNLCIDGHRRNSARPSGHSVSNSDAHIEQLQHPAPPVATEMEQTEQLNALRSAIATLPERQRTALTLCYLQGFSNADAAAIVNVQLAAMESLLARARRSLKALLQSPPAASVKSAAAGYPSASPLSSTPTTHPGTHIRNSRS